MTEKSELNDYLIRLKQPPVTYVVVTKGQDHQKDFMAQATVLNTTIQSDWKKNKKEAEKDCAKKILDTLKSNGSSVYSAPNTNERHHHHHDHNSSNSSNNDSMRSPFSTYLNNKITGTPNDNDQYKSPASSIYGANNLDFFKFIVSNNLNSETNLSKSIANGVDNHHSNGINSNSRQSYQPQQQQQQQYNIAPLSSNETQSIYQMQRQISDLNNTIMSMKSSYEGQLKSLLDSHQNLEREFTLFKEFTQKNLQVPFEIHQFNTTVQQEDDDKIDTREKDHFRGIPSQQQQSRSHDNNSTIINSNTKLTSITKTNIIHHQEEKEKEKDHELDREQHSFELGKQIKQLQQFLHESVRTEQQLQQSHNNNDRRDSRDYFDQQQQQQQSFQHLSIGKPEQQQQQQPNGMYRISSNGKQQPSNNKEEKNQPNPNSTSPRTTTTTTTTTPIPTTTIEEPDRNFHEFSLEPLPFLIPDKIQFYQYDVIISHHKTPHEFIHLNKKFLFQGFKLYSHVRFLSPEPVIHILRADNDHCGVGLIEKSIIEIDKFDFQKLLTFNYIFFCGVLSQHSYMHFKNHKNMFYVPVIQCLSDPNQTLFDNLMDMIKFDYLSIEYLFNTTSVKEYQSHLIEKFKNKIIFTCYKDYVLCKDIDFDTIESLSIKDSIDIVELLNNKNKSSSNSGKKNTNNKNTIQPSQLRPVPQLYCIHSAARQSKEFWNLKPILFFDDHGDLEDPNQWIKFQQNQAQPFYFKFEEFMKPVKYYTKPILNVRSLGITSEIHALAKTILLPFYSELGWNIQYYHFISLSGISLKNHKLFRTAYTHPSMKHKGHKIPNDLEIFYPFKPHMQSNQRLEFLGDSVLKLISSVYLFINLPEGKEGDLSKKRSDHTKNEYLREIAKKIGLDDILRLTTVEEIKKPHSDVMEALIGAFYKEKGFKATYSLAVRLLFDNINNFFPVYRCNHPIESLANPDVSAFLKAQQLEIGQMCLVEQSFELNGSSEEKNNHQRLEFLGDSVLDLIVAEFLFDKFPDQQEGFLTDQRSYLVKNENLAKISKAIGIPPQFNAEYRNLILQTKKLGDYFESFLGCLYLDRGMEVCKTFVYKNLGLGPDFEAFKPPAISDL
ncbi:hypothetical protein CYY_001725 [Polysphondylium violaceum]|uniref:Uncharacterized protein n=1 Tax=Polysphondylium violaceum TaxID=133409 RepID=A0A8J4VAA8_9MYCE|nr:hypothetical protein CYY_001725 [Polysphondylium violaceum]